MTRQKGDKKIQQYTSLLTVLFAISLMTLLGQIIFATLLFDWFVEGSEYSILINLLIIVLIVSSRFYISKGYNKLIFHDNELILVCSIPFVSRTIFYKDILNVVIDDISTKRIIETKEEFFLVDNADSEKLKSVADQKNLKIRKINVA